MDKKKLSLKIFILPYICTSIFLFYFFKTSLSDLLNFSVISVSLTSFLLLLEIICLKIYKKIYNNSLCCIFSRTLKTITALSIFYAFLCILLIVLNLFGKVFTINKMLISSAALLYSVFPATLFLASEISFFKLYTSLKNKKIKLNNPDAAEDIYNSQILIIDEFESFSNLGLIKNISENKKIILVSGLVESKLRVEFKSLLSDAKFYNISSDELPSLKSNTISVYSSTDILPVLRLVKLLNKSFIIVSEKDLNTLCCKISQNANSDINISEKDIGKVKTTLDSVLLHFNNYQKCLIYQITLSLTKIICTFTCAFFCSYIPFEPIMLVFANLICDILPMFAFIFDVSYENKSTSCIRERFSHIVLDSLLLGIVNFIVFMLSALSFSYSCASVICINTYIISSLLYAINLRSEKSIFFIGILTNKLTNLSFLLGVSATVIITLFIYNDTSSITASGWIMVAAMALIPFIVNQLQKAVISFFYK